MDKDRANDTAASDKPVRVSGVRRDEDDKTALRKIARACIALAQQQLEQEREEKSKTKAPRKGRHA